jgi:VanZ family protein
MKRLLRLVPVPFRKTFFLLALGAVAFVSLWSRRNVDAYVAPSIQQKDYMIHFGCYLVLGALAVYAYGQERRPWRSRLGAAAFCSAYGVLMEVLQMLPAVARSCSVSDMLDNFLGSVAGAMVAPLL